MISRLINLKLFQLILLVILVTGLINYSIYFFDLNEVKIVKNDSVNYFFPSSKIIGTVWTFLLVGLIYVFKSSAKGGYLISRKIFFLFLVCIFYPVYTLGFSSIKLMVLGNLITIFYSSFIIGFIFDKYKKLALIVFLIPIWVIYVTYLMFFTYD